MITAFTKVFFKAFKIVFYKCFFTLYLITFLLKTGKTFFLLLLIMWKFSQISNNRFFRWRTFYFLQLTLTLWRSLFKLLQQKSMLRGREEMGARHDAGWTRTWVNCTINTLIRYRKYFFLVAALSQILSSARGLWGTQIKLLLPVCPLPHEVI